LNGAESERVTVRDTVMEVPDWYYLHTTINVQGLIHSEAQKIRDDGSAHRRGRSDSMEAVRVHVPLSF